MVTEDDKDKNDNMDNDNGAAVATNDVKLSTDRFHNNNDNASENAKGTPCKQSRRTTTRPNRRRRCRRDRQTLRSTTLQL